MDYDTAEVLVKKSLKTFKKMVTAENYNKFVKLCKELETPYIGISIIVQEESYELRTIISSDVMYDETAQPQPCLYAGLYLRDSSTGDTERTCFRMDYDENYKSFLSLLEDCVFECFEYINNPSKTLSTFGGGKYEY